MPALHLLILFPSTSSRGADRSLLSPLSERSSGQAHSSKLQPTSGRRVTAHLYQGNLLAIQALQTSEQRRDVLQRNFKPTTELQSPTEPRRPHDRQRRFHRTTNGAATLFPLFMDGNTTGLNIDMHITLSKTVYRFYVMFISVICDVVICW